MRRKVSTILDENLVRRARMEAVRQEKQLNRLIADALEAYLREHGSPAGAGDIVGRSWAAIPLGAADVLEILREDGGLLED